MAKEFNRKILPYLSIVQIIPNKNTSIDIIAYCCILLQCFLKDMVLITRAKYGRILSREALGEARISSGPNFKISSLRTDSLESEGFLWSWYCPIIVHFIPLCALRQIRDR
jgi:hypothetical protein